MSLNVRRRTHLSRYFAALRVGRGLRPAQLATLLGASNPTKIGSLIRNFELGEQINDHWLQKLLAELQPDPAELQSCLEQDQEEVEAQLERDRLIWEAWADQSIDPFLSIRYCPGAGLTRMVPNDLCNSREQAEDWAANELKQCRFKGNLSWSRRERTWYDEYGLNPRRGLVTFEDRSAEAWIQENRSRLGLLADSGGGVITCRDGLYRLGQ